MEENKKSENRIKKEEFVSKLTQELKSAKSTALIDYKGMNVSLQQDLKSKLKEAGARMKVFKNSLFKLAAKEASLPSEIYEDDLASGQTALIFAEEDAVAPIQTIGKFTKQFEVPVMKAGVIEGKFIDGASLLRISELPSKEVLFGQAVGSIASPLYGLLGILNGKMQELVYVLSEASKRKGGE